MASDLSAFDIIGPRMTGPSSSHTAGAARIGRFARKLLGEKVILANIRLHGSFAATCKGHATDRALINGLLDHPMDSDRLSLSFDDASNDGLEFHFESIDLGERAHPNTVCLELYAKSEKTLKLRAASIGGSEVMITEIDGFSTSFKARGFVLVAWNTDHCGFLAQLTALIARDSVNIAEMHVTRWSKAGSALTVCVIDNPIRKKIIEAISALPNLLRFRFIATDAS